MRRKGNPVFGRRFLGNVNKKEVHDLDNEKTGPHQCQIDEIIKAKHARTFNPDSVEQANRGGYDNCAYCLSYTLLKKALITVKLGPEASRMSNTEIVKDIRDGSKIPWCAEIENIEVMKNA